MTSTVVNGKACEIGGHTGSLLAYLRSLGLTGAKPGCGEGACGACTVLLDGTPVLACRTPTGEAAGRSVETIEGLAGPDLHPVQKALAAERAAQCGYCTPGMALRAAALLAANPDPSDQEIAEALDPSLCRCGCHPRITRAVHQAAAALRGADSPQVQPAAPRPGFARPAKPWDLTEPGKRDWFGTLGDGLAVVWSPPAAGTAQGFGRPVAAWLHISPSGVVTAFTGKVDIGQDNQTALRLLVAEELGIPLDRVRLVQGDTDLCPWDAGTFGSRSMPDAGEALRRAAAGARQILIRRAATNWEVDPGTLSMVNGIIAGGPDGASVAYEALVTALRRVEVLTAEPPVTSPRQWRTAGRHGHAASRADAVTGARKFVSDLELPGMLHGAVLRPPVPGSTLRAADTSHAAALPQVTVVRDGDFIGLTAPDQATARRAIAAIVADWDLPPHGPTGLRETAAFLREHPVDGEGWQHAMTDTAGDPDAALRTAVTTLEATYITPYIAHVPLETRAAVADWTGGRLTVWTGCNTPFAVRGQLAAAFGMSETDVRVLVPDVGGGFGGKHGEEALEAARLGRAAGKPVKVHWSRAEEFRWGYVRPMAVMDVRAGLDETGAITAWDFLDINAGANGFAFPYAVANLRLRYQPADTLLAQGPYRALSATANTFGRESAIDELAHAAGSDPLEFRLRHMADTRLTAVLEAAARRFGWRPGMHAGVAAGIEKGGRVATCAEVAVRDGVVRVTRIVTAYECGAIVNPDTVTGQIEGGTIMALGGALFEQLTLDHGHLASVALADYRVPRFTDLPAIDVVLVDRPDIPSAGAGETPLITVAPAIAGAIFAATGRRLRSLPLLPAGA